MKRLLSVAAAAALALTGAAVLPQTAAADINCTGTMTGSHDDTIHVPAGRGCTLNNITLDGNVKLGSRASVTINGGYVDGNIQAEEASPANVVVTNTRVGGNIQVKYATGTVRLTGTTVDGDIQVMESRANIAINDNRIGGNLQCKSNTPPPTGSGNVVRGNAEDQCRSLTGSGGGTTPPPSSNVDVYVTPGRHHINGRTWVTTCSRYSSTIDRCRTNIVATQVSYERGRFVTRTGEVFNNLTYKASPRSQWVNNPLGAYGKYGGTVRWTGTDGRQWRTECDSAATGRGGCRNYVRASVIEYRNGAYRWVNKEVLNSMLRFS